MKFKKLITGAIAGAWILMAVGCGGSSSSGDDKPVAPPDPATYAVGGAVYGLQGTLVLQLNGGESITFTADGTFKFSTPFVAGNTYSLVVQTQPASQICTVVGWEGTITDADLHINVNCSIVTRPVQGTVQGLAPSESVVLQNNGGDDLVVSANGDFAFATPVAKSSSYAVSVLTQPAGQTCTVVDGSGTVNPPTDIDVSVICSSNAFLVGGTVSGLSGTVVLQNNNADDIAISVDGPFTFATPVAAGASYNVAVSAQPASQTCVVTNGSGTVAAANVNNVGLSCTPNTTTLSTSVSNLAVSVAGQTEYGVPGTPSSGLSRKITVTNTGIYAALNFAVNAPTWPTGTTSSTTCGSLLSAGSTCEITVTPGSVASSDGTNPCSVGTAPLPAQIGFSADNATTVSSTVVVLDYGCIYQGGYVYAFDDTTANTDSVGGKVMTTTDQAAPFPSGIIWSSNGSSGTAPDVASDTIYGISEFSTASSPDPASAQVSGQVACDGAIDGACNTSNIYIYYQNNAVNAPINTSYYAAGLCKQTISGYSDWSLPAICELGYGNAGCGMAGAPNVQNMQSNLVDYNGLDLINGFYWSSTEAGNFPNIDAWVQLFSAPGFQTLQAKTTLAGVRCSRALSL